MDDNIPHHPKFVKAGALASWLWVCGNCYCNRYLTDGFISQDVLSTLGNVPKVSKQATMLVDAGLWEAVDGGYLVHDFHDHNPKAADVKARREQDRIRKESAKNPNGNHSESVTIPEPRAPAIPIPSQSHPNPKEKEPSSADADFEAFWTAYPRKVSKEAARKVWRHLKPDGATQGAIFAALFVQGRSTQWLKDATFIPHASTWLRGRRWEDEAPRGSTSNYESWVCPDDPPCEVGTSAFRCHQRHALLDAKKAASV